MNNLEALEATATDLADKAQAHLVEVAERYYQDQARSTEYHDAKVAYRAALDAREAIRKIVNY